MDKDSKLSSHYAGFWTLQKAYMQSTYQKICIDNWSILYMKELPQNAFKM
jgi:hypothetical protein